jgi:DNA-binding SARP family transcriptional activator
MKQEKNTLLRIHLLGAMEIAWAEQTIALPRRQTRALLARLAATLEPITRDQLCFLFWPDEADTVARRNLTKVLTHLRRALPQPEMLIVSSGDVRFDRQRVWSDAAAFVEQCSLPSTRASLQQTVTLYRGAFLDGFALDDSPEFESWAGQQRHFFEQHYLQALARLIDLTAADRDYRAAITYAQRYLTYDDLAEEIHRRLIECYAASGDRAAALRQYEACVAILERELGVDPLPETRAAYTAALTYRPIPVQPTAPPLTWTTLPGLDAPLVGRTPVLDQLTRHFTQVRQGQGRVVLIAGEAGIGKSRLLQEFAQSVGDAVLVLAGADQPGAQTLPYHAITQALRRGIHLAGATLTVEPIWLAEASLLLPELRTLYPDLPHPLQTDPIQARTRLFEALCRLLLALTAADRPLLLCLDDLHWADNATLDWIAYLGQRLRGQRVLLIGAYRSEEPDRVAEVRRVCQRLGILSEVELGGLTLPDVAQLLHQVDGDGQRQVPLTHRLHRMTGGNAFFLLELLQALRESGRPLATLADDQDLPLSQTVSETVMRRFRRLSPVAQQMAEAAAVLGLDFPYALIQRTAGRGELESMDGLDELVKRRLLAERDEGYTFHHDITRRVIYGSLSHGRRRLLHRRAAESLEALHAAELDAVSGQIAGHYAAGALPAQALPFYQRAATVARQLFALQAALDHLQRAVDLLPLVRVASPMAAQVQEAQADLLVLMGQHEKARAIYAAIASLMPTPDLLWQVQIQTKLAKTWSAAHDYPQALALYDAAEALLNTAPRPVAPDWWHAWFAIQFARTDVYYFQARLPELTALLTRLQEPIQQHGSPMQQMDYYHVQAQLRNRQERFRTSAETLALIQQIFALAHQTDDRLLQAEKAFSYGFYSLWHGAIDQGIGQLQAALQAAETLGVISLQNRCLTYLTIAYRLQGDRAAVRRSLARSSVVAQIEQRPMYLGTTSANQAWLYWCDGAWDAAVQEAQAALQRWQALVYPMQWLARLPLLAIALQQGRLDDAIHEAQALLHPEQQQLPAALTAALQAAVDGWMQQQSAGSVANLHQALHLAQVSGHL